MSRVSHNFPFVWYTRYRAQQSVRQTLGLLFACPRRFLFSPQSGDCLFLLVWPELFSSSRREASTTAFQAQHYKRWYSTISYREHKHQQHAGYDSCWRYESLPHGLKLIALHAHSSSQFNRVPSKLDRAVLFSLALQDIFHLGVALLNVQSHHLSFDVSFGYRFMVEL